MQQRKEAAQQLQLAQPGTPVALMRLLRPRTTIPTSPTALPVPLERGSELREPRVRQQHSQHFFVHYLLNNSPSWSIFSLVMHYLQMLVETKSTLDVPISFLSASQDTDSVVIFC